MKIEGKKNISSLLKKLEEFWDTPEKTWGDVPDGPYQVKIESAVLNESKASGRLQVSFQFNVLEGDFINRKIFKHSGLDNESNIAYFRGDIGKLGHEWPETPEGLEPILNELLDSCAEIKVKTSARDGQEYTNVYITRAIDPIQTEEEEQQDIDEVQIQKTPKTKKFILKKEEEGEKELTISYHFEEDDINDAQKEKIMNMAEKMEMNLDLYNEYIQILKDMCEANELSGAYESPKAVIRAIEAAM